MKTLSALLTGLVLSLTLAGQATALQNSLPANDINNALQMKIDKEIVYFLSEDLYFQQNHTISLPMEQDKNQDNQSDVFSVPDCLCHLFTRVM